MSLSNFSKRALALCALIALSFGVPRDLSAETLRTVPHAQLEVIDPIWTTAYITRTHGYLVYDTLFGLDAEGMPQPQMVDTWDVSEDGLTWVFTLRPEQTWHDGTDVTSEDCVASLKRWGARDGVGQGLFSLITNIATTDDSTFEISLSQPYPTMTETLAQMSSNVPFIMPKRIADTDPNTPIDDPTGSGPYIFVSEEWKPGESAAYVRNDNYVPREEPTSFAAGAKIAFLDRIEWVSFPSQENAMQALIEGEVQYLESPSVELIHLLDGNEDVTVTLADAIGSVGMAVFNHQLPPFDNPGVRRAIVSAMDQEAYMNAAIGNPDYWQVCPSIYPCGTYYSNPVTDVAFAEARLEAAREELREAGYDGTPVVVLDPVDSPVISAFTQVSLQVLNDLGVNVDHQEMTWAELVERRAVRNGGQGGTWNMFHTWWFVPDLSDPLRIAFSGDPDRGWIGWPNDPTLEAMRAQFLTADSEQREIIASDIQDRIADQANFAILGQFFEPIAFRKSVLGLQRPIQMYYNLSISRAE